MSKKSFVQGAMILGVAGVIIKLLGAFFRIPLGNIIGDDGMGFYQTAYPVYVLLLTVSTAGIPTAISKMVSERIAVGDYHEAHRVFKISFILLLILGLTSFSILFFGAEAIVARLNPEAANAGGHYIMMAIAPALFFVPLMAAYRGYFQGMQDMRPTAYSQIIEQLFRVVIGLSLAYVLFPKGLAIAASGASFGATAGGIAGLIGMAILYLKRRKGIHKTIETSKHVYHEKTMQILSKIAIIAIPITIGASIMPIMNAMDLALVMRRLEGTGAFTSEAANSLYGQLSGMVAPLINFPQVISMAIAVSIVPAVSAAFRKNDTSALRSNVDLGVRMSLIIGLPCAIGLMVLSEPIMLLLYPAKQASAISAAPCLFIMAFGVIFLSLVQTLTGILQGIGKQMVPVGNLFIGAVVKFVITYTLTGIVAVNVKGAAIGTVAAYIVASSLNLIAVKRYTGTKFNINLTLLKPGLASIIMGILVYVTFKISIMYLGNAFSTLIAVGVGVAAYGVVLIKIKGITSDEIKTLPKGEKLVSLIKKLKLID